MAEVDFTGRHTPDRPWLVSGASPSGTPLETFYRLPLQERLEVGAGLAYSPDGRWVAYGFGDYGAPDKVIYDEVYIVELASGRQQKVFSFDMLGPGAAGARLFYPADLVWSADSSFLYIAFKEGFGQTYRFDLASGRLDRLNLDPSVGRLFRELVASLPGEEGDLLVWERPPWGTALVVYGTTGSRRAVLVSSPNGRGSVWFRGLAGSRLLYAVAHAELPDIHVLDLETRRDEAIGAGFGARFRPPRDTVTFLRPAGYESGAKHGDTIRGFEVVECQLDSLTSSVIATFPQTDQPVESVWSRDGHTLYLVGSLSSKVVFP